MAYSPLIATSWPFTLLDDGENDRYASVFRDHLVFPHNRDDAVSPWDQSFIAALEEFRRYAIFSRRHVVLQTLND